MSRASKTRGSQPAERDSNSMAMQMSRTQQQAVQSGPVAILWDMENCPVPSEVKADDVAGNIRMALRQHPVSEGAVTFFSAYGDFNHFPKKVREGCQRTGVNLIDVPNGKKDASDKAILVDLFLLALDNRPPSTIFLISGDVDFAPALHKLGQRGYTVLLAVPSGVGVSSALRSAGRFVWDWVSVAKGGAPIPAKNSSKRYVDERIPEIIEMNGYAPQACPGPSDDSDLAGDDPVQDEEEDIVWKSGAAHRYIDHAVADGPSGGSKMDTAQRTLDSSSAAPHSSSGKPSQTVNPSAARELGNHPTAGRETSSVVRAPADTTATKGSSQNLAVQTGNLPALREQLVRLLSLHGGKLELGCVLAEYQKQYKRPLPLAEYGYTVVKMEKFWEKLRDSLFVRGGEGASKTLQLTRTGSRAAAKLKREAEKRRGAPKEEIEVIDCGKSHTEDLGDAEDETAGEVVVVAPVQKVQTLMEEVQTLLTRDKASEKAEGEGEHIKDVEEIYVPVYDWEVASGGSGGSGDEKDNDPQEERDVEVDDSTLEQVVKNEGSSPGAAGLDILDAFRLELQELLVSHACKIVMTEFVELYEQRYSRPLDYAQYGVKDLESLIEKVCDIAEMKEEAGSNVKFLVAS